MQRPCSFLHFTWNQIASFLLLFLILTATSVAQTPTAVVTGTVLDTTGGSIPDPKNRTAGIKGGVTNDIKPGDVIVIPPGSAHWFSKINGHVTYLETRFPGAVR